MAMALNCLNAVTKNTIPHVVVTLSHKIMLLWPGGMVQPVKG